MRGDAGDHGGREQSQRPNDDHRAEGGERLDPPSGGVHALGGASNRCVRKVGFLRTASLACRGRLQVVEQEREAEDRKHHDKEDDDRQRLRARLEELRFP